MAAMLRVDCRLDPPRTLDAVEFALAAHPHQLNLLLAAGARRLAADRPSEAEAAFSHAAEIAPRLANARLGLALTHEARGDRAGAQAACREARTLDPALEPARAFCAAIGPDALPD
jgi:Flp pilus assembly protein TadD